MENKVIISVVTGFIVGKQKENVIHRLEVSEVPHIGTEIFVEDVCYKVNRVVRTFRKVQSFWNTIEDKPTYKDNKVEDTIYVFVTEYMVNVFQ